MNWYILKELVYCEGSSAEPTSAWRPKQIAANPQKFGTHKHHHFPYDPTLLHQSRIKLLQIADTNMQLIPIWLGDATDEIGRM